MNTIRPCKSSHHLTFHFKTPYSNFIIPYKKKSSSSSLLLFDNTKPKKCNNKSSSSPCIVVKASSMNERPSFLSLEEAGLVEISGLNTHERFLCRLTISSLNLLRVIAEEEGCKIEELNAGRICDWFLKDKLKREQNIGSAVLQWDDEDPFDLHF